jgi:hypothetical protein
MIAALLLARVVMRCLKQFQHVELPGTPRSGDNEATSEPGAELPSGTLL